MAKKPSPFMEFKPIEKVEKDGYSVFDIEEDLKVFENRELRTKRCGSVDKFNQYLNAYIQSKSSFTIVSYGATKKIVYGNNSFIFSGVKGEKKPQGMHLISLVKKDIDSLVSGNPEILNTVPKIPSKKPHLTHINYKNCRWYGTGVEILSIDVNHCYWRTAYLLGYIKEETYLKGIEKDEYKEGRLIAIGTLGKILTVRKYENGLQVKEYIDDTDYLLYGRFFWHIISKINIMLQELISELKEDFLMFLTDCIFIDPSKRDLAISIMEKHGYSTKEYLCAFTNVDNNKLNWITDKGEEKQMVIVDY